MSRRDSGASRKKGFGDGMNGILQDLRYGLRGLRKQPGSRFWQWMALALGIGSVTTIFRRDRQRAAESLSLR